MPTALKSMITGPVSGIELSERLQVPHNPVRSAT